MGMTDPSLLKGLIQMTYEMFNIVGDLGAMGIVLWLVIRTTNHTIPKLASTFEEGLRTARADFKAALELQREDFYTFVQEQRTYFADQIKQEHQHIDHIANLLEKSNTLNKEKHGSPNSH
jgi:cAMP phosphodiesterase